jgi:small-conductance mechanosensitive channel
MRLLRTTLTGFVLTAVLAVGTVAAATTTQEHPLQALLRQLYTAQLQAKKPDPSVDKRIVTERANVRKMEADELAALVQTNSDETGAPADPSSLVKQQELVDALDSRNKDAQVDLDLVDEELKNIPDDVPEKPTDKSAYYRTKADALARQAILQERLGALDEVLSAQEERLDRLRAADRSEQFVDVIRFGGLALAIIVIIALERLVRAALITRIHDRNRRYLIMKFFTGTIYVLLIAWALYRIASDYPGVITSFAILGAGIALALQAVIKDVVGWVVIMQKRLYTLGQRVAIGPYVGDVADISVLRTTLVEVHNSQYEDVGRVGQTLNLPNAMVLDQPVLNFHATSDYMETEMQVVIDAQSDWHKAESILHEVLDAQVAEFPDQARSQFARRTHVFFVKQEPMSPRVFMDLRGDKIVFTLRFQVPIGQRRSIASTIAGDVIDRFKKESPAIRLAELK